MPYAKEIVKDVIVMDTSASDNYIPDMAKEAVELLALIHSGAEKNAEGVYVGPPQFMQQLRLYKAACSDDVCPLTATFTVNGCVVPFTAEDSAETLYEKYKAESDRKSAEYKESPEGKAQAAESAQRVIDNQRMTDEGFAALRAIVEKDWQEQLFARGVTQPVGELAARIFMWLASLVDSVDFHGIKWDADELRTLLLELGYKEKQYSKQPEMIKDAASWRAYIAGQCIHCLRPAPEGFGRIPPFASFKIRERGLDTETFISEDGKKMRTLTQYERKKLLDAKLDEGARLWNSDSETFEEYMTALEIPTQVEDH